MAGESFRKWLGGVRAGLYSKSRYAESLTRVIGAEIRGVERIHAQVRSVRSRLQRLDVGVRVSAIGIAISVLLGVPALVLTILSLPSSGPPITQALHPARLTATGIRCGLPGDPHATTVGAGWGPVRPMYTMQDPAVTPVLNSIEWMPDYGNEAAFVDSKPAFDNKNGSFCDMTNATYNGEVIVVRSFLDTSAASNLGGPTGSGTVTGAHLRYSVSGNGTSLVTVTGIATAQNITNAIFDTTEIRAPWPFVLRPLANTANGYWGGNNRDGTPVSDTVWTTGAQVGPAGVLDPSGICSTVVVTRMVVDRIA